jgi:hypothetical protein
MKHIVCAIFWLVLLPFRLVATAFLTVFYPVYLLVGVIYCGYQWSCYDEKWQMRKEDLLFIKYVYWNFLLCNKWG